MQLGAHCSGELLRLACQVLVAPQVLLLDHREGKDGEQQYERRQRRTHEQHQLPAKRTSTGIMAAVNVEGGREG